LFIYDRHQEVRITTGGIQNSESENRHDITEILLKVALNTLTLPPKFEIIFFELFSYSRALSVRTEVPLYDIVVSGV